MWHLTLGAGRAQWCCCSCTGSRRSPGSGLPWTASAQLVPWRLGPVRSVVVPMWVQLGSEGLQLVM